MIELKRCCKHGCNDGSIGLRGVLKVACWCWPNSHQRNYAHISTLILRASSWSSVVARWSSKWASLFSSNNESHCCLQSIGTFNTYWLISSPAGEVNRAAVWVDSSCTKQSLGDQINIARPTIRLNNNWVDGMSGSHDCWWLCSNRSAVSNADISSDQSCAPQAQQQTRSPLLLSGYSNPINILSAQSLFAWPWIQNVEEKKQLQLATSRSACTARRRRP